MSRTPECKLCCMTPCDPAVDAAVRRVHAWLREGVLLSLAHPAPPIRGTGEKWGSLRPPKPAPVAPAKRTYAPRDRTTTPQEKRRKRNVEHYAKIKASTDREGLRQVWRERGARKRAAAAARIGVQA